MDMLKKYFPYSFTEKKDVAALIINIIAYVIVGAVIGAVIGFLSGIPLVGWIIGILGTLVEIYVAAGIIISVLDYLKILK